MKSKDEDQDLIELLEDKPCLGGHTGKAGLWTHGLDVWTFGLWTLVLWTTGRFAWTLYAWTLDAWMFRLRRLDPGRLDA